MFGVSYRWVKIYSSVIIVSVISKITGFFRDALITARFGATLVTDAYVVALLVPEVLFNIFGNSLSANFAPVYYEAEHAGRHRRFVSTLFSLYLLLAGLIFIFGRRHTDFFITLFSSGFKGLAFDTTAFLMKIFMANIFFITLTYLLLAYLQAHNRFLIPSTIGIWFNLAIIGSMLCSGTGNALYILIIGTMAGYVAQFAVQMPQAVAQGLPVPALRLRITPEVRRYLVLTLPVAVLAVLGQLNIAMDNYFASRLSEGSITTLNLGYRVLMGVYSLFITNTMMIVYPALSKSIVRRDTGHASAIVQKTTDLLIILLTPLAFYLFCNAEPLIEVMFKRGAFTADKSLLTAMVFRGYIVGLVFYAFRDLLLRYFFAEHSAVIPMLNGLFNSSLNFIYLLVLVPLMGLPGVSLATAVSAVSSCTVLFILARKKSPIFRRLHFIRLGAKILGAAGFSVLVSHLALPSHSPLASGAGTFTGLLRLGSGFLVFALVYCVLIIMIFRRKVFLFFVRK